MKILYFSAIIPSQIGAASYTDYTILKHLSELHTIDAVIIKSNKDTGNIPDFFNQMFLFNLNNFKRIIRALLFFYLPGMMVYRLDFKIRNKLLGLLKNDYDIILFSMSQTAIYALLLRKYIKSRKILIIHDVLQQVFLRKYINEKNIIKKIFYYAEYFKLKHAENKIYNVFECCIVQNEKDKKLLKNVSTNIKVIIPPYKQYNYSDIAADRDLFCLCFFGSFARFENIDAVTHYLNTIHKRMIHEIPNYKYIIIGIEAEKHFKSDKYTEVYGFQNDPSVILNRCRASVITLRYGAGIKIKVLELLCMGLPCFCTTVASEGISEVDGLITNDNLTELGNNIMDFYKNDNYNKTRIRENFLAKYGQEKNKERLSSIIY